MIGNILKLIPESDAGCGWRRGSAQSGGASDRPGLTHKAIIKLVAFAKANRVKLGQSYPRVTKRAVAGRYIHAGQFKRAPRFRTA